MRFFLVFTATVVTSRLAWFPIKTIKPVYLRACCPSFTALWLTWRTQVRYTPCLPCWERDSFASDWMTKWWKVFQPNCAMDQSKNIKQMKNNFYSQVKTAIIHLSLIINMTERQNIVLKLPWISYNTSLCLIKSQIVRCKGSSCHCINIIWS